MPQLEKGGKFTYGWSLVDRSGAFHLPAEAAEEYNLKPGTDVIILNGSRRSGGLAVALPEVLWNPPLAAILQHIPEITGCGFPQGQPCRSGERCFCRTIITGKSAVKVPLSTLAGYGVNPGDRLLTVRGSYRALAFIKKGPIVEEALRHPELAVY